MTYGQLPDAHPSNPCRKSRVLHNIPADDPPQRGARAARPCASRVRRKTLRAPKSPESNPPAPPSRCPSRHRPSPRHNCSTGSPPDSSPSPPAPGSNRLLILRPKCQPPLYHPRKCLILWPGLLGGYDAEQEVTHS